jgi:hypothetical protein
MKLASAFWFRHRLSNLARRCRLITAPTPNLVAATTKTTIAITFASKYQCLLFYPPPLLLLLNSSSMFASAISSTPSTSTDNFIPSSAAFIGRGDERMHVLLDEQDHERCSQGNRRALLSEKLDVLRALTKDLQQDDWMYAPTAATDRTGGRTQVTSLSPWTLTTNE